MNGGYENMSDDNRMIRILHVDDNEDYLDLLGVRLPLEDEGITIDKAKSAKTALSLLSKNDYDCVLVDYEMPGMNGLELLNEAKERHFLIPFIFLTGQGNEEIAAQAFRLGADDYFTKDTTFAHFPRLVNSIKQNISKYEHLIEQQKFKDTLLKQEQRLRALVTSMDELIFLVDVKGVIIESFIPSKGYKPFIREEMTGKKLISILPRDICSTINEMCLEVKNDFGGREIQYSIKQKTGNLSYLLKILPFLDFKGKFTGFLIVISDITEKIQSRQKIIESENRYRFILENSFDYVYQIDIKTGKYTYMSPKVTELMGLPLDEIMNTPYWGRTRILSDDMEKVRALDKLRDENPEKETVLTFRMLTANNQIRFIEQRSKMILEDGEPKYIIGVFKDVDEAVKIENINRKLFSVFKDLSAELSDAVLFIADSNGLIFDIVGGKDLRKKYNYSDELIKNRHLEDFLEARFLENNLEEMIGCFKRDTYYERHFLLNAKGTDYFVYGRAVAIKDINNNLEMYIVLLRDVTEFWDPALQPPTDRIIIN